MGKMLLCASAVLVCLGLSGCGTVERADSLGLMRPLRSDIPAYRAPELRKQADKLAQPTFPKEHRATLTLRESLGLALQHNPELQSFAWELRVQEAEILQASLPPNPVLTGMVENFGGHRPLNHFEGAMSTFRLSQLIELGEKRMKRKRLAEENQALSAWDYEAKRLEVITQVARRYIEVLADQQRVALAQETLALTEQMYKIVQDRAATGVVATVQIDKALVRVSDEQIQLHNTQQKLAATRQQLTAMWGNAEPVFTEVTGELENVAKIPEQQRLMQFVLQNPHIARWGAEIARRQAVVAVAESLAVPSVTLGAGLRRFNATDENAFVVEVGVPLKLFDRNQGGRLKARYNLLQAQTQQKNAEIRIQSLLIENYKKLAAAHYEVVTLRDETLPAARSAYAAARQTFEKGLTDYLDVLDAERTLVHAEKQYIETLANYHQTTATLEGLIGESLANIDQ